jgi:hypothetical protein
VLILAICVTTLLSAQPTRQPEASLSAPEESLRSFLVDYIRKAGVPEYRATRYSYSVVDLNGDRKGQVVVYLEGPAWCGTGGCMALILAPQDVSYRVVSRILGVRPPIRALATSSHGWRDISVWVQGAGIPSGYYAVLHFDGRTYPINPAIPPAGRLANKAPGHVLIGFSRESKLLYP